MVSYEQGILYMCAMDKIITCSLLPLAYFKSILYLLIYLCVSLIASTKLPSVFPLTFGDINKVLSYGILKKWTLTQQSKQAATSNGSTIRTGVSSIMKG